MGFSFIRGLLVAQFLVFLGNGLVQAQATSNLIVPFRKVGSKVEFTQPQGSISFSLQSQVRNGAPWAVLSTTTANNSNPVVSLSIPAKALKQNLRVLATVRPSVGQRRSLPFTLASQSKSLTFRTTNQARLYSVERYQAANRSWTRVSTVAASSPAGRAVSVNLPSSLGKLSASSFRVMAVSGDAPAGSDLYCPVSARLRSGLSKFPARQTFTPYPLLTADTVRAASASLAVPSSTTTVEEADIWKIRGRKIYLFNQHRGLQVLDTTAATNPVVAGFWPMPAVGEDLYLLGATNQPASGVLLLAQLPWRSDRPNGVRILRLAFSNDVPSLEASLDLPGDLQESRMVGNRLHVVSTSWQDEQGNWSPTTWVITLDVSQAGVLTEESRQSIPRYVSVVGSTEKYLWLAGAELGHWAAQTLTAFPIQPEGTLGGPFVAQLGGIIQDKFKVGDVEGGLAVVAQSWIAPDGSWKNRTLLETYRSVVDSGGNPSGLMDRRAQVEITQDEWLYATRFDGNRLYAVTFRNTDPLWLIDLSDPALPAITGHLQVPGWSSFIEPMGDLLLAVGRERGQVQVSLFDVSDRSNPTLASRVNLGDSGYSWSEAEWNEKAVKILPDAGLILIPFNEWVGSNVDHSVRILDLNRDAKTITAQGIIHHSFSPRRSTLLDGDLIASVSNRELILVDAVDRQAPSLKAEVTLAFGVDRLALYSGYVYQFENANTWMGDGTQASLRVAPVEDPDGVAQQIPLAGASVQAAEVIGDRLVVVEGGAENFWGLWVAGLSGSAMNTPAVSVWSLASPSQPSLLGRVSLSGGGNGNEVSILPGPSGSAIVTRKVGSWGRWGCGDVRLMSSDSRIASCGVVPRWYGFGSESLTIDSVQLQGVPASLGSWTLQDGNIDSITPVQAFGDLLVFGYQKREPAATPITPVPASGQPVAGCYPGLWQPDSVQTRSWIQVIDLANLTQPSSWAPVEIPGALLGFSWLERGGGVLFSRNGLGDNRVDALGFDGENAAVAAELDVGPNSAILANGTSVYASGETGIKKWVFSESTGSFSDPVSWMTTSLGAQQLAFAADVPVALMDGTLYGLGKGEAINLGEPPGWVDLRQARADDSLILIPAGPYGTYQAKPSP